MFSFPLWRYVLTAVSRDRIIQLLIVMMLVGLSTSMFLGSTAVVEKQAFVLATTATVLRILAILGLVIFIGFFVRRSFENREIEYLLAKPITRNTLLFSFSTAFMTLSFILTCIIALFVLVLAHHAFKGWWVWSASVFVELSLVSMITLFFSTVLRSATVAVLCSLGYYSLGRMLGAMIGIILTKLNESRLIHTILMKVIEVLSIVTPRFDLLAQSAWLIRDDVAITLWMLPAQFFAFSLLFFFCAAFDLRRSQF